MHNYTQIIVSPEELTSRNEIRRNILLRHSKNALVLGTIISEEGKLVEGAIIRIQILYSNQQITREIGWVMTNQKGDFAFVIEKRRGIHYLLKVYEPMISNLCSEC